MGLYQDAKDQLIKILKIQKMQYMDMHKDLIITY